MQKNYVNATLMLRLSLDRCQEIQSYGSHSNHNLATPSPTSPTTLLKHIRLKLYDRHQTGGGEALRGRNCAQDPLELLQMGGLCLGPPSGGQCAASGSTGTEWPLPEEKPSPSAAEGT